MISSKDRQSLAEVVEREDTWMAGQGISWSVSRDFEELRRFGYDIAGFLNSTYDPKLRTQGPDDIWCRFTDRTGKTIGSVGIAVFRDCEFADMITSGHMWYDDPPTGWDARLTIDTSGIVATGDVAHGGAIMVHPDWRTKAIGDARGRFPNHMMRLARAYWLSQYDADWWTGSFRSTMFNNKAALFALGINPADCTLFMDGYMPIIGFPDKLYAMQMPVPKLVATLRDHMMICGAARR